MPVGLFKTPIRMLVGLGYPTTVASALMALRFLEEQPGMGSEKIEALAACRAVIAGHAVASTARTALVVYAKKKDLLLDDVVTEPLQVSPRARPLV